MVGFIGDALKDLKLVAFADANLADRSDNKSTGGWVIALVGPNSFFVLSSGSKKHTAVSNSSVEAEIVAANIAVRLHLIPLLELWSVITGNKIVAVLYEDNQATAQIIKTAKFRTLAHVPRTHGIQVSFLSDHWTKGTFELRDCRTRCMAADIHTIFFHGYISVAARAKIDWVR